MTQRMCNHPNFVRKVVHGIKRTYCRTCGEEIE